MHADTMVYVAAAPETGEREKTAKRMLHLKGKLLALPVRRSRVLHLTLMQPAMSGYDGPAWTPFCYINVYLGGRQLGSCGLPVHHGEVPTWKRFIELPMGWDWPRLSLELEVQRSDYYPDENLVFRQGPHTSNHTEVLGTARVPLIDALVLGEDSDDDEGEGDKKRRRDGGEEDGQPKLVEGTRMFDKMVPLQRWQLPAPKDKKNAPDNVVGSVEDVFEEPDMGVDEEPADVVLGGAPKDKKKEEPANVARGVVHVFMCLVEEFS